MGSVNIAIFGLSLRVLNDLKEKIQAKMTVNWKSVSDPNLDLLLVNEVFIDSPSIQGLIKKNALRVLKVVSNGAKFNTIEDQTLYLPLLEVEKLEYWIKGNINSHHVRVVSDVLSKSYRGSGEQVKSQSISGKNIKQILKDMNDPRSGNIKIFDEKGFIALADPRSDWVWVEKVQKRRITNASLNSVYATSSDMNMANSLVRQNMRHWLWNMLWRSDFSTLLLLGARSSDCYLLQSWPQPDKATSDRKDILRMSACFAQGASISLVSMQLGISQVRVQQFIAACIGVGIIEQIHASEAKYNPQKSNHENNNEEVGFVRKLFGKLRSRLGF